MKMEAKNPLFIIGTGRSGSTIFHEILSYHPNVAWLSQCCNWYPDGLEINRWAMRFIDLPWPVQNLRRYIKANECYPFWEHYAKGFSDPNRDLLREDVTDKVKKTVRLVMAETLTPKRSRVLIKLTGWPRVGFVSEVFPDAKFIHIYRDGRAVANSLLQVDWWKGWRGPENWTRGELSGEHRQKWEKYGKSFVVLAALEWEILMSAYDRVKQWIPSDNLLEMRYEDLCQNPVESFRMAVEFAGLDWSPEFEARVKRYSLVSGNDKWKKDLSYWQQKILCESLRDSLLKYGYT